MGSLKLGYEFALQDDCSKPHSKTGDALWQRTAAEDAPSPAHATPSKGPVFSGLKLNRDRFTEGYNQLFDMDQQVNLHTKDIEQKLDSLSLNDDSRLTQELVQEMLLYIFRLQDLRKTVEKLDFTGDQYCLLAQEAVVQNINKWLSNLDQVVATLKTRLADSSGISLKQSSAAHVDTDKFSYVSLLRKDPRMLLGAFIVIVMNVFGRLSATWSNVHLGLIALLFGVTLGANNDPKSCPPVEKEYLERFPKDIKTARNIFGMAADIQTWAACPQCHYTYPPGEYPVHCTHRRFPNSRECGAQVCRPKVVKGESVLTPVKPFEVQNFATFKANLISRPGIEALLDRGLTFLNDNPHLLDIRDGAGIYAINGPDGKIFCDGLQRSELRLLWSFSVDWFNPYTNKSAGKSASIGSIALACLNLPPSLRYAAENLFLAAIIPGRHEPPLDASNHYIRPVVTMLDQAWRDGVHYSSTPLHPKGRFERSAVAVAIFDLPGARKITGQAHFSFKKFFCSLCLLPKHDINNINWTTWGQRNRDTMKEQATRWRDAPTKAEQDKIFQETGMRWSALWELEYFDPTMMVIVDSMHNLFLGLVHHLFRVVLGFSEERTTSLLAEPPCEQALRDAEILLRQLNASQSQLNRKIHLGTLQALCLQHNIEILRSDQKRQRRKKKDLISALQLFYHSSNKNAHVPGPSDHFDATADADLLGAAYFEDEAQPVDIMHKESDKDRVVPGISADRATKAELKTVRHYISATVRPTWHCPPPKNFGMKGAGKLKADQWRSGIEFDFVVAAARLYSPGNCKYSPSSPEGKRRAKLFEATMNLALAIRWGTSDRTSSEHATKYMHYMYLYLQGILHLYPELQLSPNDHAALHIGEMLLRFGPTRGWWMFPFERLIGRLQKVQTNNKIGQMESTIMRGYCEAANLKGYLEREDCVPVLKMAAPIIKKAWRKEGATAEHSPGLETRRTPLSVNDNQFDEIKQAWSEANARLRDLSQPELPSQVYSQTSILINGYHFTTRRRLQRNSAIFFTPIGKTESVPAHIVRIMTSDIGSNWLVVRRVVPLPKPFKNDPFANYPEFGASLWSDSSAESLEVVPTHVPIHHFISQPWTEKGVRVLKILNRMF